MASVESQNLKTKGTGNHELDQNSDHIKWSSKFPTIFCVTKFEFAYCTKLTSGAREIIFKSNW